MITAMARILDNPDAMADALRAAAAGTAWRREPLSRKVAHARRLGLDVTVDSDPIEIDQALERHIGSVDLLPGVWLRRGLDVADAVARLDGPNGDGSGFLVSPWLLLTNNHMVGSPEEAAATQVRFRYEEDMAGRITRVRNHRMDPGRFFVTSPPALGACAAIDALDYTVVALDATSKGEPPGDDFGWISLIGATGKILLGQPVNIIQHPRGSPRQIAIRNNRLLNLDDERCFVYETDTDSGSSGSPVFNDRWELVALHHTAVDATDDQGRKIDRNGDPVTADTPENLRDWKANAGIRVSAIVADLQAHPYTTDQQKLVDELLTKER
jgi:endonuclease G, mitochondrial